MKRVTVLILLVLFAIACGESEKPKPLSVKGEQLYTLDGKIVSRDKGDNSLRIDHKAVAGLMEAMTMDYSVRGANVAQLPPDGSVITAKLHVVGDAFWLTDVRRAGK
jgi:hypothetical protein